MAATQASHIRPASMGRIMDRAVTIYRKNFVTLVGVIALMQIPIALVQIGMNVALAVAGVSIIAADPFDPTATPTGLPQGFGLAYFLNVGLTILTAVLVNGIATAALTKAAAAGYLGEKLDIIGAYQALGRDWITVLLGIFMMGVISAAVGALSVIAICAGWVVGPGLVFFLRTVITPLVPMIIVVERVDPIVAFRRAWDLTRRRFWWFVAFAILLYVFSRLAIAGPINIAAGALTLALQSGALGVNDPAVIQAITQAVSSILVTFTQVFLLPIEITALLLAYFDIRIRTEGWDISLVAHEDAQTYEEKTTLAPQPVKGGFIKWEEIGYFALITIAFISAMVVLYGALFAIVFAVIGAAGGF